MKKYTHLCFKEDVYKKNMYLSKINFQNGWLQSIRKYEKVLSTLIAIGNNSKREMNYEREQKK